MSLKVLEGEKLDENCFVFRTNPKAAEIEQERIKKLRAKRDNNKLNGLFDKLRKVCESGENVMPIVMEVTKEGGTVGEVCNIYREILGTWDPPIVI